MFPETKSGQQMSPPARSILAIYVCFKSLAVWRYSSGNNEALPILSNRNCGESKEITIKHIIACARISALSYTEIIKGLSSHKRDGQQRDRL